MSYFQLSEFNGILNDTQISKLDNILSCISANTIITLSKFSNLTGFDINLSVKILKKLIEKQMMIMQFAIRCPRCGLLLKTTEDILKVECEIFCYNCEDEISISTDDVEVIYKLIQAPFVVEQQIDNKNELVNFAVPYNDSLTLLLQQDFLDFNSLFFSPTNEQYSDLENNYQSIFENQKNTKEKGDKLEFLVLKLFDICKHFKVSPLRLRPNQIDCYVRNKLFIPGIFQKQTVDGIHIECKNETTTPKSGYMNKLHSILKTSGKLLGIIVSKCKAPKTFITLSNQIFLCDKIVIIWLDKDDLNGVIFKRKNLLEYIARKIDEVKLNATADLVDLGLYDT